MIVKKPKNYLNNKDILKEFRLSKEQGKMTEEFGKMMIALATKYSKHPKWVGYSYREDMVCNAILTLCKVWQSFDDTKYDNPFSYYTQVCTNSFIQQLNTEKRQRDIKDEVKVQAGLNASYDYKGYETNSEDLDDSEQYDRSHEFDTMEEFEDNSVYDVTHEYTESAVNAAFSSEPEMVIEEEFDEESLEYDNALIKEYLEKVTPTPSMAPKRTRAKKAKPSPTPCPTPTKTPKPFTTPRKENVNGVSLFKLSTPDKYIVRHSSGGYCVVFRRLSATTQVKVNLMFSIPEEAYAYRDLLLNVINEQISQGIVNIQVPPPIKRTRKKGGPRIGSNNNRYERRNPLAPNKDGTSGFKYVSFHKRINRYVVHSSKIKHGTFKTLMEAVEYRDQELDKLKGA